MVLKKIRDLFCHIFKKSQVFKFTTRCEEFEQSMYFINYLAWCAASHGYLGGFGHLDGLQKTPLKVLCSKNFFCVYFAKHCCNISQKTKLLAIFTAIKQSPSTKKQAPRWGGETLNFAYHQLSQ